MHNLRFRQIHLDFHTSPFIPGIGEEFDKAHWQNTLKEANVDSITCFATCHHGWSYYETKVGNMHPELKFDLLKAQYEACKEIDINVPIYLTGGVNDMVFNEHPEWREINPEGRYAGWKTTNLDPGFAKMCFNTPYLDYLCDVIREVAGLYPDCDGIFIDIISQGQCTCPWCMKSMQEKGFDPLCETDRLKHAEIVLMNYYKRTTEAAREKRSDMPIFHNSGHIEPGNTEKLKYFSHLELESLPTGGWGYDHFPMSAKYCAALEHDFLGMTGKFHTTWGEFGGLKHPNALRYECAAMLAVGAKCSIGDQLHPCGKLDESTYGIIGAAYKEVAAKEAWCNTVKPIADIALLSSTSFNELYHKRDHEPDIGAGRILLEGHFLFDIINENHDLANYRILILPDDINIEKCAGFKEKIAAFLAKGGKLVLTGDSGLNADKSAFLFDTGAEFCGKSEFSPSYMLPADEVCPDFVKSPLVMYLGLRNIKATKGKSLGKVYESYFNRTYKHYCSHQHTPYKTEASEFDCGVINDNILYIPYDIFSMYFGYGAVAYKEFIVKSINLLLGEKRTVTSNMPSTARLHLMNQPEKNRDVLHLLYATPTKRGSVMELSGGNARETQPIEVIDEILPLSDVEISINTGKTPSKITLEPQAQELQFTEENGKIKVKVASFTCHQMVVLQY